MMTQPTANSMILRGPTKAESRFVGIYRQWSRGDRTLVMIQQPRSRWEWRRFAGQLLEDRGTFDDTDVARVETLFNWLNMG